MNRVQENALHCVCLCKGRERYVVLFDEPGRREALRTLGRWASNHELSFTWYDAARLSKEIREGATL
jgi:hypothetical protein